MVEQGRKGRRPDGLRAEGRSRTEDVPTARVSAVPRLSIGLPVYNGERHISAALEALLGQTYEDFELIVSDNASTDGTSEICLRYTRQDRRIRYIRQERNIGLVPNHIFVLKQARGELFKSAAHDDLYPRLVTTLRRSTRRRSTGSAGTRLVGRGRQLRQRGRHVRPRRGTQRTTGA